MPVYIGFDLRAAITLEALSPGPVGLFTNNKAVYQAAESFCQLARFTLSNNRQLVLQGEETVQEETAYRKCSRELRVGGVASRIVADRFVWDNHTRHDRGFAGNRAKPARKRGRRRSRR